MECAVWSPVTGIVLFAALALSYVLGSSLEAVLDQEKAVLDQEKEDKDRKETRELTPA